MKIAFIVATLGDFSNVNNCFNSFKSQLNKNFTVFIGVQGKNKIDTKYLNNYDYQIRYFKPKGLTITRNKLLDLVDDTYDLVSFMDDDSYFMSNYVESIISFFSKNNVDILSGVVVDPISNKPIARSINNKANKFLKITDYNYFMSSVLTFKRKIFRMHNFDKNFGLGSIYGSSEETDLFFKTYKSNNVFFTSEISVFHPSDNEKLNFLKLPEIYNRGYSYGFGRGAVFKKYFLITSDYFFVIQFIKSLATLLFALIYDLIFFNFKFFIRDLGSLIGRIMGYLKYVY